MAAGTTDLRARDDLPATRAGRIAALRGSTGVLAALAAVTLVWAGMVTGISFLETPAKFNAPSLSLPVALDVGRHVFGVFGKVELVWSAVAAALLVVGRPRRPVWIALATAVAVVAVQAAWLLPLLDRRVGVILAGGDPSDAPYHVVYVGLELLKLGGLAFASASCLHALAAGAGAARREAR